MSSGTVIGFDPASSRNLGWSIIRYKSAKAAKTAKITKCVSGTFTFPVCKESWRILGPMYLAVEEFLQREEPDLVVIEQTSAFRGPKAGGFVTGQVSYCIGVILSVCSKNDMNVGFVYPSHVKKVLTGKGRASKVEVRKGVKTILEHLGTPEPVTFDSDHASDATGNVLVWLADNNIYDLQE